MEVNQIQDAAKNVEVYIKVIKKLYSNYEAYRKITQDLVGIEIIYSKEYVSLINAFESSIATCLPCIKITSEVFNSVNAIFEMIEKVSNSISIFKSNSVETMLNLKNALILQKTKIEKDAVEIDKEFGIAKKAYIQKCNEYNLNCDIMQKNLLDPYDCKARESLGSKIIDGHKKIADYQSRYKAAVDTRNSFVKATNEDLQRSLSTFESLALSIFKEVFSIVSVYAKSFGEYIANINKQSEELDVRYKCIMKEKLVYPKISNEILIIVNDQLEFKIDKKIFAIQEILTTFDDIKVIINFIHAMVDTIQQYQKSLTNYYLGVANTHVSNVGKLGSLIKKIPSYFNRYTPKYSMQWRSMFESLVTQSIQLKSLLTNPNSEKQLEIINKSALHALNESIQPIHLEVSQLAFDTNSTTNSIIYEQQQVEHSSNNDKDTLAFHQAKLIELREKQEEIKVQTQNLEKKVSPKIKEFVNVLNKYLQFISFGNTQCLQSVYNRTKSTFNDIMNNCSLNAPILTDIVHSTTNIQTANILKEIITHYSSSPIIPVADSPPQKLEENKELRSTLSVIQPPTMKQASYREYDMREDVINTIQSTQKPTNKSDWFSKKFQLTSEEKVVNNYSCALQLKIVLQGRLYITNRRVCFHSYFNDSFLLLGETKISIPLEDIVSISKKKNVLIFDNSIELQLKSKTYLFVSFFNRNESFKCIELTLQNYKKSTTSNPILISPLKNNEDEISVGFIEYLIKVEKERKELFKAKNIKIPEISFGTLMCDAIFDCPIQSVIIEFQNPYKSGKFCTKVFNEMNGDSDSQYFPQDMSAPTYFLSYKYVISNLYDRYLQNRSFSELNDIINWPIVSKTTIKFKHKIDSGVPFLPKSANLEQFVVYYWVSPNLCITEMSTYSKGVPKCDSFYSWNCLRISQQLSPSENGIKYQTRIESSFKVVMTKDTILRGPIESAGLRECKKVMGVEFESKFRKFLSEESARIGLMIKTDSEKIVRSKYEFPSIEKDLIKKCGNEAAPYCALANRISYCMRVVLILYAVLWVYVLWK